MTISSITITPIQAPSSGLTSNQKTRHYKVTNSRFTYLFVNIFIRIANVFLRLLKKEEYPIYQFQEKQIINRVSSDVLTSISQSKQPLATPTSQPSSIPDTVISSPLPVIIPITQSISTVQSTQHIDVFGNKYEGLHKLASLLKNTGLEGIAVPSFKGLPHGLIETFLKQRKPVIFELWNSIAALFDQHLKSQKEGSTFLLESSTKTSLNRIRMEIKDIFRNNFKDFFNLTSELNSWIDEIASKKGSLMVRSSSHEDSRIVVNAGGNVSECYVEPTQSSISDACGSVVASYFSESSLKNRIEAGTNPFSSPLVLSVLLQELIGEPVGETCENTDIPVSLVLFSNEPSYTEPGFRVSKISSTWGHGEAVVNADRVNCDTIYACRSIADTSSIIEIYDNQEKTHRLSPIRDRISSKINLQLIKNPLSQQRSLDQETIKRLFLLGEFIEKENGCPMDIEAVVQKGIIYVVQARPIVRVQAQPTYLSDEVLKQESIPCPLSETLNIKVLVTGIGSATILTSSSEILICDSLKQAEHLFSKNTHKLVIVGKDEPANSHPVVNFSSLGITCLYYHNLGAIQSIIKKMNSTKGILCCPQSERIGLWDLTIPADNYIKTGYFSHPAPMSISLDSITHSVPPVDVQQELSQEVQHLIRAMKEAVVDTAALSALNQLKNLPSIFSLSEKIKSIQSEIENSVKVPNQVLGALEAIKSIDKRIQTTFKELEANFQVPHPRLQRLFHIKTLANLLNSPNSNSVYSFSLLHVPAFVNSIDKILSYQRTHGETQLSEVLYVGEHAISNEDQTLWEKFLGELERAFVQQKLSIRYKAMLINMIQLLDKHQALTIWFHLFFIPKYDQWKEAGKVCEHLVDSLELSNSREQQILDFLEKQHQEARQIQNSIASFGDKNKFESSWEELKKLAFSFCSQGTNGFPNLFIAASKLSQILAIQLMKKYTELFDNALKTMKQSSQFTDKEKLEFMNRMLKVNIQVLKIWLYQLIGENKLPLEQDWPLDKYFNMLTEQWNSIYLYDVSNLQPSRNFNVQASILSSRCSYNRHQPKTLEDLFTLIHQNQLFALGILNRLATSNQNLDHVKLPPIFQQAKNIFTGFDCIGIEFNKKEIKIHYNRSLRNHSAVAELCYSRSTPSYVTANVHLLGEARERWQTVFDWMQALDHIKILTLKEKPQKNEGGISFSWQLDKFESLSVAKRELEQAIAYSMEYCQYDILQGIRYRAKKGKYIEKWEEWFFLYANKDSSWGGDCFVRFMSSPSSVPIIKLLMNSYGDSREQLNKEVQHLSSLLESCACSLLREYPFPKIFSILSINAMVEIITLKLELKGMNIDHVDMLRKANKQFLDNLHPFVERFESKGKCNPYRVRQNIRLFRNFLELNLFEHSNIGRLGLNLIKMYCSKLLVSKNSEENQENKNLAQEILDKLALIRTE